jgi:hypothetical protein
MKTRCNIVTGIYWIASILTIIYFYSTVYKKEGFISKIKANIGGSVRPRLRNARRSIKKFFNNLYYRIKKVKIY